MHPPGTCSYLNPIFTMANVYRWYLEFVTYFSWQDYINVWQRDRRSKRSGKMLRLVLFVLLFFPNRDTSIWMLKLYSLCYQHIPSPTSWTIFMELHIKTEMDLLMSCGQGPMAMSSLEAVWESGGITERSSKGYYQEGLHVAPRIRTGSMHHTSWVWGPAKAWYKVGFNECVLDEFMVGNKCKEQRPGWRCRVYITLRTRVLPLI